MTEFGKQLRLILIDRDMKGKDLASMLGCSRSYVSAVQTNKKISSNVVNKIINILNLNNEEANSLRGAKAIDDLGNALDYLSEDKKDILKLVYKNIDSITTQKALEIKTILGE